MNINGNLNRDNNHGNSSKNVKLNPLNSKKDLSSHYGWGTDANMIFKFDWKKNYYEYHSKLKTQLVTNHSCNEDYLN
jgi:hypothetical protein